MTNYITNLDLLQLSEVHKLYLETAAGLHKKNSNITFLIRRVLPDCVKITVSQGKHLSKNYASEKELVKITKETFYLYVGNRKIHVVAIPYSEEMQQTQEMLRSWIGEPSKIDYNDTRQLVEDLWLFLTNEKMPAKAMIKKEAFEHEVGVMIDLVRTYAKEEAAKK